MGRLWLLGGTAEGRRLAEEFAALGIRAVVTVTTRYGGALLEGLPGIEVKVGSLDQRQMEAFIHGEGITAVIDATHPYAAEATRSIGKVCAAQGLPYVRLERRAGRTGQGTDPALKNKYGEGIVDVAGPKEAVEYLSRRPGNILLTTGSKEMAAFAGLEDFSQRLYVRVLPLPEVLASCLDLGVKVDHVIGMQGPFSREMNEALLKMTDARYLVTKDGGEAGGFSEKVTAARNLGIKLIVIRRPEEENPVDGHGLLQGDDGAPSRAGDLEKVLEFATKHVQE